MGIVENTYAELKQQELKNNPYSCLHMADIDINPHQVEAFTFNGCMYLLFIQNKRIQTFLYSGTRKYDLRQDASRDGPGTSKIHV